MDYAKINRWTCPFCDGYLSNFYSEQDSMMTNSRVCRQCAPEYLSYCIIQFSQDQPAFLIVSIQDLSATIFWPMPFRPTTYTNLHHYTDQGRKLLATIPEALDLNPAQPQQFWKTFHYYLLFS
jgi:hypothetical protein